MRAAAARVEARIAARIATLSDRIGDLTARLGQRVDVAALRVTDRGGELSLGPVGGLVSPNGACRLFPAADGWMALNLARDEDHDLVPAWLECDGGDADAWALLDVARDRTCAGLVERAGLLGLPASQVGEAQGGARPPQRQLGAAAAATKAPRVLDLSALWAGPLCGAVLAAMGAEVTKVESVRRPDPTRTSTPGFHTRLNGAKAALALDLAAPAEQERLRAMALAADVVITSCRPRAWASLGLDPHALMRARPGLTWVAITGHGLAQAGRVAFGDDAAAAGGLLDWTADGEPRFAGDALSDPLTGLAAAVGALEALTAGGGVMVDAGMATAGAAA